MNLLTTREADIVLHALRVASERFRENAKAIRDSVGDVAPGPLGQAAIARLAAEFDGYHRRCNDLVVKLEARAEIAGEGIIEITLTPKQLTLVIEGLDVLFTQASGGPSGDELRADCNVLMDFLAERKP